MQLKKVYREVARTDKIDPDIILINIGNGNRSEIAALLLDIDKCSPLMVGIDAIFPRHMESLEDSILAFAIEKWVMIFLLTDLIQQEM